MMITRHKIVASIKIKMMKMIMMDQNYGHYIGHFIDFGNYKDDDDDKTQDCGKYKDQDEDDGSRFQKLYWELN